MTSSCRPSSRPVTAPAPTCGRLLTTEADSLLSVARDVVHRCLAAYEVPFDDAQLQMATDVVFRTTLSHVTQPSGVPARSADDLARVAARVLRP